MSAPHTTPPAGGGNSIGPTPTNNNNNNIGAASQQRSNNNAGRHDESWIEVSSHPSSSSVSSIGDEIVTAGLDVRNSYAARRRRLHPRYYTHLQSPPTSPPRGQQQQHQQVTSPGVHGNSSSQDEYDESDSSDDRVLTSSNENVATNLAPAKLDTAARQNEVVVSSDDDDHATALGRRPSEPFRPQPNAFSHPPSHLAHRNSTSAIPPHHPRPSFSQRSQTRTDRADRGNQNFMSPSYQADNDAALRASLTTLLSVAAAARSRSKEGDKQRGERLPLPSTGSQPVELRLIPESELIGSPAAAAPDSQEPQQTQKRTPRSRSSTGDKTKRSSTPTGSSKSPRATKKKKTTAPMDETYIISPALMTWVVGAGVVVLVSAVGFGAGYVIGREVGRQEALGSLGVGNTSAMAEGGSCGREVLRSSGGPLKRLRWGGGVARSATV
ncbi:hypothetical protein MN608_04795 [Microdochium nivale]|nr:hypothetical protein MN608_04795 [Microdochium nivale]